jgi:uncharacterized protein
MVFEWDEGKRRVDLEKHGIDVLRAKEIWQGDVLEAPAPQAGHGEARILAYGMLDGRVIAVGFTWRGGVRRLIGARRARDYERDVYTKAFG